jgi:hypothetical protein
MNTRHTLRPGYQMVPSSATIGHAPASDTLQPSCNAMHIRLSEPAKVFKGTLDFTL